MGEDAATTLDARTAEVLRCLDRAKGTIAKTPVPTRLVSAASVADDELRGLGEAPSQATPDAEAMARSLDSAVRVLERVVVVASERLSDLQRGHDAAVRELRDSVHALLRQADVLAAWRAWWTTQIAAWALLLALLFAGGVAFAWRAHALAQNTHDILDQILENQTKAQAAKATKRR
jgi:hypothetical protein